MPKVTLVGRSAKDRIRNTSKQPAAISQVDFRSAFPGAQPLGPLPGDRRDPLSLVQISQVLERTLRSSGGRPALAGADEVPIRVSLMQGDRAKVEVITQALGGHARPRPSPAQIVAVLCHLALTHMSETQIALSMEELMGETRETV